MIYHTEQLISHDMLIDKINTRLGHSAIDWENRAKSELFNGLGEKLKENLSGTVTVHEDNYRGHRKLELKLVVYAKKVFDKKIKIISDIMDRDNISGSTRSEILRLFLEDEPDFREEKTYI